MKKLLLILMAVGYTLSMTSCSTEQCWAYRDCSKYQYNNHKNRPSVAISKGKKRMKLRY
jgi:hypothetical protein